MYIYNGKLNWSTYAIDETITIVFAGGFALNDPVSGYWQWTDDGSANGKKANTTLSGIINAVVAKTDEWYQVSFSLGPYNFKNAIVAGDFATITTTMSKSANENSGPLLLNRQYGDLARVPSTAVFTGKLNWDTKYSNNEMITLVVPNSVSNGAPIGLYTQWTSDDTGNTKINYAANASFRDVTTSANGDTKGTFDTGYYTFEATVLSDQQSATLSMSSARQGPTVTNLKQTDFRGLGTKKALIFRYNTNTDNGIFLVQTMLVDHLGFAPGDIQMCYFDIEPSDGGPKQCTQGQLAPTATRFKSMFTDFISSAVEGDVRFLYVDVHGTTFPDEEHSGEQDDEDEAWTFAEGEDGATKELVKDDWLATAISDNFKLGINLTILTSSCMGGGMLDTHTATPGILLAGCHETQFNVKALKTNGGTVDPWMYAITSVIKNSAKRKRDVPTYTNLFEQAKKIIEKQIQGGQITGTQYKGPSPDETKPIAFNSTTYTSNQDPQLIFYDGYIDPDTERFLFPFVAPNGGKASGTATRYPSDEVAHDEL